MLFFLGTIRGLPQLSELVIAVRAHKAVKSKIEPGESEKKN